MYLLSIKLLFIIMTSSLLSLPCLHKFNYNTGNSRNSGYLKGPCDVDPYLARPVSALCSATNSHCCCTLLVHWLNIIYSFFTELEDDWKIKDMAKYNTIKSTYQQPIQTVNVLTNKRKRIKGVTETAKKTTTKSKK